MDIFSAFPSAIIYNTWEIGLMNRDTEIGKTFESAPTSCDVIIDEEEQAFLDTSPQAEYRDSNTLIYAKPDQLPTLDTGTLQASYLWHNIENDTYYEIRRVGIGKNQDNGVVEHVEFEIHQTEVAEDE